jgi:gliding motility-associated-like protein
VFTIQLSDVNEAPTLNVISNQTLCYTSAGQVIALSGISAGPESGQSTMLTVSSNNPGLFQSLTVVGSEIRYTAALNQIGVASVTVKVQDNGGTANGGVDEFSRTFTIRVNALPDVTIISSLGTSISKGATTLLSATGGTSYQWSNASGIISGQNSPVLTVRPLQGTTYTVSVTNASGCVTTQNITIQVVDDYAKLLPANNFSPNGDGINDAWVVENLDAYPDHKLTIFDRGGRILYTVRNYDNTWDGRVNGALLDEGTYFYVFVFNKPGINIKRGFITIVH